MRLSPLILLSLVTLGCDGASKAPDDTGHTSDTGADTGDSTGDTASGDCPVDDALLVEATLGEVATVVHVTWSHSEAVTARVRYTDAEEGAEGSTGLSPEGTSGAADVLGLLPNHEVRLWVEATVGGETRCSAPVTLTTGGLPSDLPEVVVNVDDTSRAVQGWFTTAVFARTGSYAAILDARGRFVWAAPTGGTYRATLARDRRSMLVNQPASVWNGPGLVQRLPLAGGEAQTFEVVGAHTDFVELPDGTLATLGWTRRAFEDDTRHLLGDTIVEIAPDGTQTVVWDIFDHVEPYLGTTYAESPVSGEDEPFLEEWSHVNSIAYDEASDDYVVTGTFNHSVMRIDRGTGALVWTLTDSGSATDWQVDSAEREVELPHSAQLVDEDTVLAFSRGPLGSPDDPAPCAWVSELDLDSGAGVATPTWHYEGEDCLTVAFLGEARRIEADNTLILWSSAGRLSQTDAGGAPVFEVDLDLGAAFGFGEWAASLY